MSNSGIFTLLLPDSPANAETYREFVERTANKIELLPRPNSVLVLNSRLLRTDDKVVKTARSKFVRKLFVL